MVGLPAPLHLRPEPARGLDRHAAARLPAVHRHVDHMHPDAVIAIAATENSRALTQRIYGDEIGWLPWRRPGFELGLECCRASPAENPEAKGVWCWKATASSPGATTRAAATTNTLRIINDAIAWFDAETRGGAGQLRGRPWSRACWREPSGRPSRPAMMPEIRGRSSAPRSRKVGHFDRWAAVLDFVNARDCRRPRAPSARAARTTSCAPRSARWCSPSTPLYRLQGRHLAAGLDTGASRTTAPTTQAYYERCKPPEQPGAARRQRGGLPAALASA